MVDLVRSLNVLTVNRINTPMIFFSCGTENLDNAIQLKAMASVTLNRNRFIIPPEYLFEHTSALLRERLRTYSGEPIVVFVAPKTMPLVSGYCTPGPYINKITIGEDTKDIYWGMPLDNVYPPALRMAVLDLNAMLQRYRHILDGMPLRFTYHPKGEGTTGDKVVIWGCPIEG